MRTWKEAIRTLDPDLGIQGLADLVDVSLEDLLRMAKVQGEIAIQNDYSVQDSSLYAFLSGLEIGWKIGHEEGQEEGVNRRIDEIADRAYDEYRRREEEDATGSA